MLTGRPAIAGDSFGDILVAICTQPLPPICAAAPWLPPSFESWFQRACAKEPSDRFQTPEALLEGLYAAAGGKPTATASQQFGQVWQTSGGGRVGMSTAGLAPTAAVPVPAMPPGQMMPGSQMVPPGQMMAPHQTTSGAVSMSADQIQIPRRSLLVPILATLGVVLGIGAIAAVVVLRNAKPAPDAATSASTVAVVSATPTSPTVPPPAPPPPPVSVSAAPTPPAPVEAASAPPPAKVSKGTAAAVSKPGPAKAKPSGTTPPPVKKTTRVDLGF
jgi:hypothetical protein